MGNCMSPSVTKVATEEHHPDSANGATKRIKPSVYAESDRLRQPTVLEVADPGQVQGGGRMSGPLSNPNVLLRGLK